MTVGIVSALGRRTNPDAEYSSFTDYIQTDAAVNPGNSGGALVNLDGEIVGINSWIASRSGGNVGLGFAIPVNTAKKAIADFIGSGKIVYGWLGVTIADSREIPGLSEDLMLSDRSGSFITNVFEGSPAAAGGIRPGDYVVRVDGTSVVNKEHLTVLVGTLAPGSKVNLEVLRAGKPQSLDVVLKERDDDRQDQAGLWPGMAVIGLIDQVRSAAGVPEDVEGVIVQYVTPDSAAAKAGVEAKDVITEVDGKRVRNLLDFYQAVKAPGLSAMDITVNRGGEIRDLRVRQ